jgi:branched-chain amino acid aminotransferase
MREQGKIWFNGKFVSWKNAKVHVLSHAIHYGSSIFEGIRCYEIKNKSFIFRLDAHIERLYDSAKIYRMEIPYSKNEFKAATLQVVQVNRLKSCYIRPLVFRGYGSMGVYPLSNPLEAVIAAWEWQGYLGKNAVDKGINVRISSWRRPAPDTFPTLAKAGGNYLNSQLIKVESVQSGIEEGIALDHYGYVSEGSGENVFMIKNGVVFTPPSSSSILAGITRHSVIVICRHLGIEIRQQVLPRESLYIADEVFLTGTASEIVPVKKIDDVKIGDGKRGEITERIQKVFLNIINGVDEDIFGWLTPVR